MADVKNKSVNIYINSDAAEQALAKLQKTADALNKKIEAGRAAGKNMNAELKKLAETEEAIKGVQEQIDKGLRPSFVQVSAQVTKLRNELKRMSEDAPGYADKFKQYQQASTEFNRMSQAIIGVNTATKEMSGGLTKVGVFFAGFASNMATGFLSVLQSAGAALFNLRNQFESSTQNLSAITGASGADLDFLKQSAIDLSKQGATSATDYVEAFKLIASAKPELLEAKEDLVAVTRAAKLLADAAGIDLPTAATKLTDALNQFGAPAAEAGKYVDALAAASKYGAAEVPEITDALLQFGAQAKSANINIYESSAAIELLAEKGIKGADAGTKLRNVFLTLNAVKGLPKEAQDTLKAAGVNTEILQNKSLSLQQRLQELSKIQNDATALVKVFGRENFNVGQIVLQNIPRYAQLTDQIQEQGVAAKQAATNTDTLTNKWEQFKNVLASRFLNANNDFLKGLLESMTKIVEPTKTAAEKMSELSTSIIHLQQDILPLATRYDELKAKTQLSKDEQSEMKSIIEKVTAIIPGAANAWDQYGNKIGISTDKVREMIQQQKNLLKYTNAQALKDVTIDVNDFQSNVDKIKALVAKTQKEIAEGKSTGKFGQSKDIFGSDKYFVYTADNAKTLELNLRAYNDQLKTASDLLDGAKQKQEELNGDALEKQVKAQAASAKKAEEDRKKAEDSAAAAAAAGSKTGADAEEEKKRAQLLKEVEAFNQKLHDLNFQSEQASKTDDQKELDAIREKYEKVFDEYKALAKKLKGTPLHIALSTEDLTAAENKELAAMAAKQEEKHKKEQEEAFKKSAASEYENQKLATESFYGDLKTKEAERFVAGETDQKVYDANIAAIDLASKKEQLQNAKDYFLYVEQAQKDLTKFTKEELDRQTRDTIAAYAAREAEAKLLEDLQKRGNTASIQTKISIAKGKGDIDGQFDGQKQLLEQERKDKLAALETEKQDAFKKITETGEARLIAENIISTSIREQQKAVDADYDQKAGALDNEKIGAKLSRDIGYTQQALDIYGKFASAKNAMENAALNKELKVNDTKKAALKKQLNSKLISEQEYNRQVAALDKDSEAKKEALAKKQFQRNQKQQIAQALLNGALAVTNIWATTPKLDFGASTYIMLGLSAAATIASVAEIASQKFADGGQVQPEKMKNGKITTEANIPTQPNGDNVLATVKVGEVILNEEQQKALGGAATFRAIGVPGFAGGGTVKPFWKNRPFERINFPKVNQAQKEIRQFATGGLVKAANATASAAGQISASIETQKTEVAATDPALLETLHLLGNTVAELKKRLDDGIEASVSLKKLDDARALKNRILNDASMK